MAGAGYKSFTPSSLASEDVNTYLMQQSVMVFASSASRSSALPVPTEGMVSYLKDTDSTEFYTGSAWASLATTASLSGVTSGFRNVLINGEFRINQRAYASTSNLASGSYGFDRWKSTFTNTTLTFTSAPQGQIVTINSGGSIEQVVERENITAGTYILSWTGTATGRVYNTGGTPPSYAASPIVVTLDGLANVEVEFTASGGTRTLWKPQLELNTTPTPFEQRPIGIELDLCFRYYQRMVDPAGVGVNSSGNATRVLIPLYTKMRAQPTSTMSGTVSFWNGTTTAGATAFASTYNSVSQGQIDFAGGVGSSGQANSLYTTGGSQYIDFSAEL